MLILIYWFYISELSRAWVHRVKFSKVCYNAVFCVVTQSSSTKGGALRDQQTSLKVLERLDSRWLPLFPRSSTLIVIFTIIVLVSTCIKCLWGINILLVLKPRLFGTISPWLSVTAFNTSTYFEKKPKLYFLRFLSLNWIRARFS